MTTTLHNLISRLLNTMLQLRETKSDNTAYHDSSITLFCIPHAGGSASYYNEFKKNFPESILLHPLELPGRGKRCKEPLSSDLEELKKDLLKQIIPVAETSKYAFFGHSMGACLAFLCAAYSFENNFPLPQSIFLSSATAPEFNNRISNPPLSSQPPAQMWKNLVKLGGIPACVAESKEFCQYLEPVLYADFKAIETWKYHSLPALPVPITLFMGNRDILAGDKVKSWAKYTTKNFSLKFFDGDHFYLQKNWETLATQITQALGKDS